MISILAFHMETHVHIFTIQINYDIFGSDFYDILFLLFRSHMIFLDLIFYDILFYIYVKNYHTCALSRLH